MVVYLTILGIVSVSGRGWDVVISRKTFRWLQAGWEKLLQEEITHLDFSRYCLF